MTMTLHEFAPSGNCYKIRLIAALTGRTLNRRHYDILNGETRTPAFLREINANGRIPVLELEDGRKLPESNAALFYLAQGSPYWPADAWTQARVLQWLFFEQYSHEPNIATPRFWLALVGADNLSDLQRALLPGKMAQGHAALQLMEDALTATPWLVDSIPTIADIALYAYTHVAPDAGFDLDRYPHIQAWLARVERLPGYQPMTV